MNAVATMDQLQQIRTEMRPLIDVAEFNEGYRYAEFNAKTDRMAEYGLGALIAGGVGAKLGLFAKLGALLLAFKKFIIIGVIALGGLLAKTVRQEEGRGRLSESAPADFHVHIEPGGHDIRVPPGENVLTAALAAGIPLPYSCRAGRCASCKAKLLAGQHRIPRGTPPGITAAEVANAAKCCSARRSRAAICPSSRAACRCACRTPRAARSWRSSRCRCARLRLRLRFVEGKLEARPGQFVDVRNHAGDAERLAVIGTGTGVLELECADDGSVLRAWLDASAVPGSTLRVAGPFDRPR